MKTTSPSLRHAAAVAIALSAASIPEQAWSQAASGRSAVPAVFREMFANNASAAKDSAAAYCIGFGRAPRLRRPDAPTLAALRGLRPAVRPPSACATTRRGARVIETASRRPALLFGVERLGCTTPDDCTFRGSYYEGNVSSATNTYRARRSGGRWTVELVSLGPIS